MKPLLAATITDIHTLTFPLLASPKLDGIRALVRNGALVSRNMKPIPNEMVQRTFGSFLHEGLDGELICGDPTSKQAFRNTTSGVMSHDGKPDVRFHVFDDYRSSAGFENRLKTLPLRRLAQVCVVPHRMVASPNELQDVENSWLEEGYEGVMLRSPQGQYKNGRSTLKEGILMKLKRFDEDEAVVIGLEEQLQNTNELTRDALGRAERSNHKKGMVGKSTLGSLRVRGLTGPFKGVEFNVGSGMDDALRLKIWVNQVAHLGRTMKFKYFPIGSKDAPRFPTFLAFRGDL